MTVVIRVNYNNNIGYGHIQRCYNFALELLNTVERGNTSPLSMPEIPNVFGISTEIIFIINNPLNHEITTKFSCIYLNTVNFLDYLKQFTSNKKKIDLIIADSYDFDYNWECEVSKYTSKLLLIDDYYREHYIRDTCKTYVLYYHNYLIQEYSPEITVLKGLQYFIGNPLIWNVHNTILKINKNITKILLYLGSCTETTFKKILKKIIKVINNTDKQYELFLLTKYDNYDINYTNYLNITIYKFNYLSNIDLLKLYITIDLCIGACGVSSYERLFLKVPSIELQIADNQINVVNTQIDFKIQIVIQYNYDSLDKILINILLNTDNIYFKMIEKINSLNITNNISYLVNLIV
jgi:spore coat polysaccharide biosynthesis predicted glycosyltransferase SpsG